MSGKLFWFLFLTTLFLFFSSDTSAEMASDNFRISSYVHSAGGAIYLSVTH